MDALPAHILALIREGRKTEAITLLREETGVDLATAKDAVDRLAADLPPLPAPVPGDPPPDDPATEAEVAALARAGQLIPAIQLYRARTGVSLAAAKTHVEALAGVAAPGASGARVMLLVLAVLLVLALGLLTAVFGIG